MHFVNDLLKRIHTLPQNLPYSHYRSWVLINYSCMMGGVVHFLFIFIFALVGVMPLALINIGSSIIWAYAVYFNLKGSMKISLMLANSEIVVHAWLATFLIGWNSGFHYHILVMPSVLFLTPLTITTKITLSVLNLILYGFLYYFFQPASPSMIIHPTFVNLFNYTNIGVFGFILAYFSYHYRTVVIDTEAQLELEHQKTNAALIERNETLTLLNKELTEAADYV